MPKSFHLSIPTPCHEDWDAMTSREQGRHCASCQKTVVDFTGMRDAQLVRFFEEYGKHESICGRVRTEQVQRPLVHASSTPSWKWATLLLTGLTMGTAATAQECR